MQNQSRQRVQSDQENHPVGPIRHWPHKGQSWFQVTFKQLFEDPYNLKLVPAMLMGCFHMMADQSAAMGKERSCCPSLRYLARKLHVNAMTVRRHVARLEELKLLEVDRTGNYENIYYPKIPESWLNAVQADSPFPF